MKKHCTIAALLVLALPALAQFEEPEDLLAALDNATAGGGGSPTYVIKQDMGTGFSNGESWSKAQTAGTINENYTTAPAPLDGAASCQLNGTDLRLDSPTFSGQNEVWHYGIIHIETVPAAAVVITTMLGPNIGIDRLSDGTIRISGSVNSTPTVTSLATGTTYHYMYHYRNDGFASFEFSTDGTFAGTGNTYTDRNDFTETAQATGLRFHAETGTTFTYIVDKIRVDDVEIGNNPE